MKLRPILFSTEMVHAILEGRKSQTRRVIKEINPLSEYYPELKMLGATFLEPNGAKQNPQMASVITCKYGKPGDVLWVRETFRETFWLPKHHKDFGYIHKASENGKAWEASADNWKWKPSIHMPKKACRIYLLITAIRVERLQEIKREDCKKEGIAYLETVEEMWYSLGGSWYDYERKTFAPLPSGKISPSMSFMSLWRSINGTESWDANPWVWVIEFKRILDLNEIEKYNKSNG